MIPAYPTDTEPMVVLGDNTYRLDEVDFIMWMGSDGEVYTNEDPEAIYNSFVRSDQWRVVLRDDSVITVLQTELDSDTREHLLNLAFPD